MNKCIVTSKERKERGKHEIKNKNVQQSGLESDKMNDQNLDQKWNIHTDQIFKSKPNFMKKDDTKLRIFRFKITRYILDLKICGFVLRAQNRWGVTRPLNQKQTPFSHFKI